MSDNLRSSYSEIANRTRRLSDSRLSTIMSDTKFSRAVHDQYSAEFLIPLYQNPAIEILTQETCFLYRLSTNKRAFGVLEISYKSVHFCSTEDKPYAVTLPFNRLKAIKKQGSDSNTPVLKFVLRNKRGQNIFIEFQQNNPEAIDMIMQLFRAHSSTSVHRASRMSATDIYEDDWQAKQQFFLEQKFVEEVPALNAKWHEYFSYFGNGSTLVRTGHLLELIHQGIPNQLRRKYFYINFKTIILIDLLIFNLICII
jgi:hypothetical protein